MTTRGYHHLICPHCDRVNHAIFIDLERGRSGTRCQHCSKWFSVRQQLVTYDPETLKGQASPLWEKAVELLSWVPEGYSPSTFAKWQADEWHGGSFTQEMEDRYLQDARESDGAPFVSEAYLYHCLGKEDARTLLSLLRQLLEAGGIEMFEAECEAARRKDRAEDSNA